MRRELKFRVAFLRLVRNLEVLVRRAQMEFVAYSEPRQIDRAIRAVGRRPKGRSGTARRMAPKGRRKAKGRPPRGRR